MSHSIKLSDQPFVAPPCDAQIEVLYQDKFMLIINKPSGLLTLVGKDSPNQDSVYNRLLAEYSECRIMHRLDFGTSGLMVVALNKRMAASLNRQFSARQVEKTYTALLHGWPKVNNGLIDMPLGKGEFPRQKVSFDEDNSKVARSLFRVLARFERDGERVSRVEYKPLTGRTHQLRLHSQALGHQMLGCDLYSEPKVTALAPRLCLHANELSLLHPVSGERLCFSSPAPF